MAGVRNLRINLKTHGDTHDVYSTEYLIFELIPRQIPDLYRFIYF
jgi:hypothetical protein